MINVNIINKKWTSLFNQISIATFFQMGLILLIEVKLD